MNAVLRKYINDVGDRVKGGLSELRYREFELLVMNTEELSPEQELVQDLITITHCFSSRLYGLRTYRKALKKALADDQSAQDQAPSNA
jgi:predicted site-specific integrase-resolvase